MEYILYGSQTSPFVRRIRLLLGDTSYEFKEINPFDTEGASELNKINPINQIPLLVAGEQTIWDSRQIFNYLNSFHRYQNMDWDDENLLTAIDGAVSSAVSLMLMKRSGFEIDENVMFLNRQRDRIESILDYLKPYLKSEALKNWNFHTMTLYSFLDWAVFRELIGLDKRPECVEFLNKYKNLPIVIKTQIPKA